MNKVMIPAIGVLSVLFFSCKNNDAPHFDSNNVDPENIWFDYQVRGEENSDEVTVLIQYRLGDQFGPALTLQEPGKVTLDGVVLKGDSSKYTGAYYEMQRPVDSFTGNHNIIFTGKNKKEYSEEFSFRPIKLVSDVPDSIERADLQFTFEGLDQEDYVRILLTDTVFASNGIDRLDTVKNGSLIITKKDLEGLHSGPVQLEFIRETERPVKNPNRAGGWLSVSYVLKREFILQDQPGP